MRKPLPAPPDAPMAQTGLRERLESLSNAFRTAAENHREVRRLDNKSRLESRARERGTTATARKLVAARQSLAASQLRARAAVPQLFSQEQSEMAGLVAAKRRVGPEHHPVELQAAADGLAHLVIRDLGTIDFLEITCKPQDANLAAYLITSLPWLLDTLAKNENAR